MAHITPKAKQIIIAACLAIFVVCIFCVTNTSRYLVPHRANMEPFWSYKEVMRGNYIIAKEVLLNIALFAPVGFMFAALSGGVTASKSTETTGTREDDTAASSDESAAIRRILIAAFGGLILSAIVEASQYIFHIGLADFDDLFNNTFGAFLGGAFYCFIEPRLPGAVLILSILAAVTGVLYIAINPKEEEKPISYALKIEEVRDGKITGYCFRYTNPQPADMRLILSNSATGKYYYLDTEYGLPRPDVDTYFQSASDLTYSGFEADFSGLEAILEAELASGHTYGLAPEQLMTTDDSKFAEYYICVSFDGGPINKSTEYISAGIDANGGIYWTQSGASASYRARLDTRGTDLEEIVKHGKFLLARPDLDMYMYQYGDDLYWIAGDGFGFDPDGSTLMQLHLHTVQDGEMLPCGQGDINHWDDRSGCFEDYEITGEIDCGRYRVSRRTLPQEYITTDFMTGYCKDGTWKWKAYIRPDF
ncbi:MAG: VanZ family protein [Lachnospiraceae bacterium]|nr:VanZ family protein [Candidatus Darwinimomas equi]